MVNALFLHPDLGIGGAERLVVDAGLALQEKGHRVGYVTNHHDRNHCFPETRDGTFPVTVVGDWLPRSIFGYCQALCAYIRMLYLTLYLLLIIVPVDRPDILICDQIPVGIPLIKLFRFRVIFYCHFPDLLLSKEGGALKALYRKPINWIEEKSISFADRVLVNSIFTAGVFRDTFQDLKETPAVLYPSIFTKAFDVPERSLANFDTNGFIILSINRFERKKNLALALDALGELKKLVTDEEWERVSLMMVGGYDERVTENVEHYEELVQQCEKLNLSSKVTFIKSPSDQLKVKLLGCAKCVLYTPSNEHFGIVPLEAMYSAKPVVAMNSGGPTETVVNGITGFLSEPVPEEVAKCLARLVQDEQFTDTLGKAGKKRFQDKFSFEAFSRHLNSIVFSVTSEGY